MTAELAARPDAGLETRLDTGLDARPDTGLDAELGAAIEAELEALWAGVGAGRDALALRTALADAVAGGKRIRPRLLLEVHAALGGPDSPYGPDGPDDPDGRAPATLAAAAAMELLHTAFVIHDDVIDGDDLRRGRPSVPGAFRAVAASEGASARGAHAHAVAGGVLAGDLALTAALRAFALLDVPGPVRVRVLDVVTAALTTSAVGELADVRLSLGTHRADREEVLELAAAKTAAYSFALPMQVGALLAGAGDDVVAEAGRAGRALGVAFQIHDDLAGVFDDAETTGKDPLADLREAKQTLLVQHARGTSAWAELEPRWGDPQVTAEDLRVVRRALEESGTRAHVEALAAQLLEAGFAHARAAGLDGAALDWLTAVLGRRTEVAA